MAGRSRLRSPRLAAAAALAACSTLLFGPLHVAQAATGDGGVRTTRTVQRYYVDPATGAKTVVDKRTVTLTVDRTTDLRSLQLVHVSWSGARPTAGIAADPNSVNAMNEEYPMVLLECRGVDSASVPAAQRISPQTCWTQFADERIYTGYGADPWPAWRADAAAPKAERAALVDQPRTLNATCKTILVGTSNQRWVPFLAADGQVFSGGPGGCAGQPPEASQANFSALSLPSNETFGVTGLDGTGEANFDVFTGEDHNSLGCSQHVPCSLVAIPVMGINCDPAGRLLPAGQRPDASGETTAQANCETQGNFTSLVGKSIPPGKSGADAVDGRLWWSASNWANRISVPLSFAPPDNACALATAGTPLSVYGSELLTQATTQWAPTFCLNRQLFDFSHVQTGEPLAANQLQDGLIEAAFVSRPPAGGFSTPVVMAPTAVTGFGIAFAVDDANGKQVTDLKLDARLLAKLLTESYPDNPFIRSTYPGLGNNPYNITFDPEFQALNPGIPAKIQDAAATLLTLSSDSDVMYALTSYIDADRDARAWLNGAPDPWGMTVNPAYKGIQLPTQSWPLLDTFKPDYGSVPDFNQCLDVSPVPYLPLVAAPTARLFSIGQDMQFAIAQSQTSCSYDPSNPLLSKLVAQGRQQAGARFMLGTVSLGDAAREGLQLAQLETQKAADAPDAFTDATGRTFVGPTPTGLRDAAQLATPNSLTDPRYWTIPYHTLRDDPAGADAYPGTMIVYAAAPTEGLPVTDAHNIATLMRYTATRLQDPGSAPGDLPDGYLPMTAADGLGSLAEYAQVAAAAVEAQHGGVPSLYAVLPAPPPSTPPPSSGSTATTTGAPAASGGGPLLTPTQPSSAAPSPPAGRSTPSRSVAASGSPALTQAAFATPDWRSNGALLLPVLAGVVLVFGAAALAVRKWGRAGGHG